MLMTWTERTLRVVSAGSIWPSSQPVGSMLGGSEWEMNLPRAIIP